MISLRNLFGRKSQEVSVAPADFKITERNVNPKYIINEQNRQEYIQKGYTIIRNAVDDASIQKIIDTHAEIAKLPTYFESDKLQTTIAFGEKAHTMAINVVKEVCEKIFKPILDEEYCRYDFGGGIIIKNKGCWFAPHQDCSIVDEYVGVTSYAWIPTVDMTSENGTFYAIPGSHLWAAWQRSSQYPSWPLKSFSKFLWDQMEPIFVNKGDILLFDSALIHASGENRTNDKRLAFNVCIIEKTAQHVQYVYEKDTPKGKVEKFLVDEEYWLKGDLWGRPKNYKQIVEDKVFPDVITEEFLLEQINKYKN